MTLTQAASSDSSVFNGGYQVLAAIAKSMGYHVTAQQLMHQMGQGRRSPTTHDLMRAAKYIGVRVRLVSNPTGIYLDKQNHELWVASFGNHTANVYSPDANGDVPPVRTIRSAPPSQPVPGLGNPHPIAYDSKREQVLVPN